MAKKTTTEDYAANDARLLLLIRAYQDPATRSGAWDELCAELALVRRYLPARVWFRFDKYDSNRGFREAQQAIDVRLVELLSPYQGRQNGVLPWLYGKIRSMLSPKSGFWKQHLPSQHDELQEEHLTPDESRDIEAPEGSSEEVEQLWAGEIDPFAWLEKHRGITMNETIYQILIRQAQGNNQREIGEVLGVSPDAVRKRISYWRKTNLRGREKQQAPHYAFLEAAE